MYTRIILNIFLMIMVAVFQLSFVKGLPDVFSDFNLLIIVLVFLLAIKGFKLAAWWAIGFGLILDIYSFSVFGINIIVFLWLVWMINFLLINFFTNRSLYSFLTLVLFANIFYEFFSYILKMSSFFLLRKEFLFNFNLNFLENELIGLGINLCAVLFIFYLLNFFSINLKPVFLLRQKNNVI